MLFAPKNRAQIEWYQIIYFYVNPYLNDCFIFLLNVRFFAPIANYCHLKGVLKIEIAFRFVGDFVPIKAKTAAIAALL
jgi:hypothetical protein